MVITGSDGILNAFLRRGRGGASDSAMTFKKDGVDVFTCVLL